MVMNYGDSIRIANRICEDSMIITELLRKVIADTFYETTRPSVLLKPKIYPDGNQWCCLIGECIVEGVVGWGNTPSEAMLDFDMAFERSK
ncbi:hypothetical protein ACFLXA_02765 [Chloroflexota bacterium]